MGFGQVEAADDSKGTISHDSPLDFAGRLLRTDQNYAKTASALRDIEKDFLDRTPALARRVLVQLVENHEDKRASGSSIFLLFEHSSQHYADDESFCSIVKIVNVDDGELTLFPIDTMLIRFLDTCAATYQVSDVEARSVQTTLERCDSTCCRRNGADDILNDVFLQSGEGFAPSCISVIHEPGLDSRYQRRQLT